MLKKIIVGILFVTLVGAGITTVVYSVMAGESDTTISQSPIIGQGELDDNQPINTQLNTEEDMGQPWEAEGTIIALDDNGMTLATDGGEEVYIELGPPDYWQAQNGSLQVGSRASVEGNENAGMIHAYRVTIQDEQALELRTEEGQPLWSGGAENRQGQNSGQGDGDQTPEPNAQVDEWVTISATLMAYQGGNMTVSTEDGEILTIQTGQPRFFSGQGVTFTVGDALTLLGYYEGDQFVAGEITQDASGLRVMLRDPNGRPLWAGPGNGNGKGGRNS